MSELSELDQVDRMKDAGEITQKQHDQMSEKIAKKYSKKDKALKIAVVALVFAILAIGISNSVSNTSNNTTLGLQIVVNNTNLAPFVAGHGGTGERVGDNTNYWNNNTPIEIFLYSHANTTGTAAEIHLFINGTKVSDTSGRALGIAEQSNRSIVAIIPQYSYYSVEMVNYHHYEWYEYQILTGNVTTNINTTPGTTNHALLSNLNWSVANHTIDTDIDMQNNSILQIDSIGKVAGGTTTQIQFVDSGDPVIVSATNLDPNNYTQYYQRWNYFYWFVSDMGNFTSEFTLDGGMDYIYNGTNKLLINENTTRINNTLNLNGNNITNSPTIDAKLNKTGEYPYFTGALYNASSSYINTYPEFNAPAGFNQTNFWITAKDNSALLGADMTNIFYNPSTTGGLFYTFLAQSKWIGLDFYPNAGLQWRLGQAGTDNFEIKKYGGTGGVNITSANLTISNLAGTGNAYVCVNASGGLYRGSPTC